MSILSCCSSRFVSLSRAAAKATAARLRRMGLRDTAPDWARRAQECERCPLRVIRNNISHCGQPFLERTDRDPVIHGCGCPTVAKARSPGEHCPLDWRNRPATTHAGVCTCKWCSLADQIS